MKKVLIVDDELSIRETLARFLERKYEVILAEDGDVAYKSVLEHKPDFIITDVNMPNMNGDELAQKVFEFNPNISVIVISGLDTNKNKPYPPSVIEFIEKPFKVKDIMEIMHKKMVG